MLNIGRLAKSAGLFVVVLGLAACANMASPLKPQGNAAQVLASVGTFKTFLAAAKAAGMTPTLESKGPIAVFAPTDHAFAQMPKGSVQALMLPRNRAKLKALVSNHILNGRMSSTDVLNGSRQVSTLAGRTIEVNALNPDKGMFYGQAKVTKPDIDATNGSVHAIDRVVLP